ncbi:hypothetical protein ABZ490_12985 [Streptomyces sp. NPDC005811]|uniref:hypothetical protein n=1 Tax=Streptomyces sp. NPDC005811 TaxID=3154565 RepID=UPI0033C91772
MKRRYAVGLATACVLSLGAVGAGWAVGEVVARQQGPWPCGESDVLGGSGKLTADPVSDPGKFLKQAKDLSQEIKDLAAKTEDKDVKEGLEKTSADYDRMIARFDGDGLELSDVPALTTDMMRLDKDSQALDDACGV